MLAARTAARLADLHYDFESLRAAMARQGLTTLQLVWRENAATFRARNPFPIGGVIEDPATGAAAAALGGYLRSFGAVLVPSTLTIHRGEAMGRPSLLEVEIPASGGIVVRGTAVSLPHSGT